MKIRLGFVSNSSSSSFVLYGFKTKGIISFKGDEGYEEFEKLQDQFLAKYRCSLSMYGETKYGEIIGVELAGGDESDFGSELDDNQQENIIDELNFLDDSIRGFFKKPEIQCRLFIGTINC